ncbi:MAG: hydrogenase maturation nickel metallochaperone HypA [Lachnospiraceae bacterium]|nr:hydrogenase maturation nickel metallochaperone HypA [Lachnospiraceae bacterium]
MPDEFDSNIVNTLKETDRKCPACDGTMDFDPVTGGLKCPYCGHTEEIKNAVSNKEDKPSSQNGGSTSAAEITLEDAESTANHDWGTATKTIICKSCGAESIYDAQVISSVCPYCGSNQVTEAGGNDSMAPGGVIPFKIDQKEAGNRFINWIKHKFYCPKAAKESAKPKNFKGMYLPYWTFDTQTASSYTAQYGKDRKVKKGDSEVTVTDWYNTRGNYDEFFDDELVCGTEQHDKNLLRGIEPYDTADNKIYKPEYVAGFGAEKYSVGVKDAWEKAKASIKGKINSSITSKILNENHADHVRGLNVNSSFSAVTFKYLLLPVWISSYKYKDKIYQFAVNGQTGKVYGKTPISAIKVILTIIIVIALFALIYYFMG